MSTPLRVLILEDRSTDAELMADELTSAGFNLKWKRVETRSDYIAEIEQPYDLILADYVLPQFNGLAALQLLHARGLDIPFIVVSGAIGDDLAVEAMRMGATDYLLKDRMARLGLAVVRALEQKKLRDDKRRAEQVLRENEKRFRALIEHSSDGVVLLDSVGTVLYASPATTRVLGYPVPEIIGKDAFQLVHPDDREAIQKAFENHLSTPRQNPVQARCLHQDGSWVWLEAVGSNLLQEPSVQAIVVNYRDITERKQNEEAIRMLNAELEARVAERTRELQQANRELESFSYSVSHDLRTPLAAIERFARLLLEDFESSLPPGSEKYVNLVLANAQATSQLVEALLAFSRSSRQPLKKELLDPAVLVRQVLEDQSPARAGRQVQVAIGDLPPCQADAILLKQVFVNLLSNALKFSRQREQACIEIGACRGEHELVYYVKDNGVGFDDQNAQQLFGVFQRFHDPEEYEGTGVGLAIAQGIIHRHGGRIWADAKVGQGATFSFSLPA